jgi:hypothetical protein
MAEKSFPLSGISQINFSALGDITLIQCEEEVLIVQGSEAALEHVKVSQESDTIFIRLYTWYDFLFIPLPAKYIIKVKTLNSFTIAGSAKMNCASIEAEGKQLDFSISGSGQVEISSVHCANLSISSSGSGQYELPSVQAQSLRGSISGSGNYHMGGSCEEVSLRISGAGEIIAPELQVKTAEIHISGSGKVSLDVALKLDVSISGSGEINYKGDPQITQHISGSGQVRRR